MRYCRGGGHYSNLEGGRSGVSVLCIFVESAVIVFDLSKIFVQCTFPPPHSEPSATPTPGRPVWGHCKPENGVYSNTSRFYSCIDWSRYEIPGRDYVQIV